MSLSSSSDPAFPARAAGFPKARQGYARGHVDEFVADTQRYVDRLRSENARLTAEVGRLTEQLSAAEAKYERIRTADLDERAGDVLAAADEQARAIVAEGQRLAAESLQQARRESEVIFERGRQELAWRRRRLLAERAELERQLEYAQRSTGAAPAHSSTSPLDVASEPPAVPLDAPSAPADTHKLSAASQPPA